jgi:competence protein ComEA
MLSSSKLIARFISSALLVFTTAAVSQSCFAQAQAQAQAGSARPVPANEQVNINEADAETLADVLQGVGQSRAKAIVEYREQNGPFDSLDELAEVNGVGEATIELNRERIVLK